MSWGTNEKGTNEMGDQWDGGPVSGSRIIKVVKYITDMIGCRGDIIFKELIIKILITAILYISVTRFRNMHFGTEGNKVVKFTDTRINI